MDVWLDKWVVGGKIHFKYCLQQSKTQSDSQKKGREKENGVGQKGKGGGEGITDNEDKQSKAFDGDISQVDCNFSFQTPNSFSIQIYVCV